MTRIGCSIVLAILSASIPFAVWGEGVSTNYVEPVLSVKTDYAFEITSIGSQSADVQFSSGGMFLDNQRIGYGKGSLPMLTLRALVEYFGFKVEYAKKTGSITVEQGSYSFTVHPGSKRAELFWDMKSVRYVDLVEAPVVKNGTLYMYSMDMSGLLGLNSYWNNDTKTWTVTRKDYTVKELGFPTVFGDRSAVVSSLVLDSGQYMPWAEIGNVSDGSGMAGGSVGYIGKQSDGLNAYDMMSEYVFNGNESTVAYVVIFEQRILFYKIFHIRMDLTAKQLQNKLPDEFRFTAPAQGYIRQKKPDVQISGTNILATSGDSGELEVFAYKDGSKGDLVQKTILYNNGTFSGNIQLGSGAGLYRIIVAYPMAAPHGTAYPEIMSFYVDYQPVE